MEKEDDDEQFVSYKNEGDLHVVRDEKLGEVTVYVNANYNISDDVVKVKEVLEQEKAFPELECTERLSDTEEKKEMEKEYSDEHSSMKSNLEKLDDGLKAEGNDGQWSVLEDIDMEVLNQTVGMTKDEIYQDEEDKFEYCNLTESDRLYFESARNRLKKIWELKEEAEKVRKKNIATFYGKSKVMKDD